MTRMSEEDAQCARDRYADRYARFGYSPEALGWTGTKQEIRFDVLTSLFDVRGASILDVGCGFGDLNKVLKARADDDYRYLGVDLVESFVAEGAQRYGREGVEFACTEFTSMDLPDGFDIVVASGIFNHTLTGCDNYDFIHEVMQKAYDVCRIGFAFDFLSDKVDYIEEPHFHASPERILGMAYEFSRNLVLRNDSMPFEFALIVMKDDSFSRPDLVFNRYRDRRQA